MKNFFVRQFGDDSAKQALLMLKDILKKDIPVKGCLHADKNEYGLFFKTPALHLLFNVSVTDTSIHPAELSILEKISTNLGISATDYLSIKNMFIPETDSSYKILEIDPSASNDEVKKAYRKMAMKYHPDKVGHLGEEFRKTADEKFKAVNEAWER